METAMNATAAIGHNNPPDPLDTALAPFGDIITEAEAWADGSPVENEGQMKAVDALIKGVKAARKAVDTARDEATRPLHQAWKSEVARWKPTEDDLDRLVKCLVAAVDGFKRKLAEIKAEAERKAREEAHAAKRAAEQAARLASEADIEAQRAAADAQAKANDAWRHVGEIAKDTVKGLRTVQRHEITDHRAALNWIAKNDREAITAFIEGYVAKNFRERQIDGVRTWAEKVAF
jgi:Sec-independent protein translocase protein TatA